ncbi:MAG: hypothetical protein IKU62_04515 [Ruminiclostridium sp.]|nr:hypothetical protein [Ruminiclostridium sp.]
MDENSKLLWRQLYFLTSTIADFEPWNLFFEDLPFVMLLEDQKTSLLFSFLLPSSGQYAIACYVGEKAYTTARKLLTGKNYKEEPVFYLQTAMMALWGNREEISPSNRRRMKDLGIRCRGKGGWLHFQSFQPGLAPEDLTEEQATLLRDGLGNLLMMVQAAAQGKLPVNQEAGDFVMRFYDPDDHLYHTGVFPHMDFDQETYDEVLLDEDDFTRQLKAMPHRAYDLEMDWSYLSTPMKKGRKKFFPRLLLLTDGGTGHVFRSELLTPQEDIYNQVLNLLGEHIEESGKPKRLLLCDQELTGYVRDFCRVVDLPMVQRKHLPETNRARKYLLSQLLSQDES